eukprot:3167746-Pyramimonas_sp.AAC.1
MPKSSTRYTPESFPGEPSNALAELFWRSGKLPCNAAEALPETLPCGPARVQARVEACWKLPRTRCRLRRGAAGNVDR